MTDFVNKIGSGHEGENERLKRSEALVANDASSELQLTLGSLFQDWDVAIEYVKEYAMQHRFKIGTKERRFADRAKTRLQLVRYVCSRGGLSDQFRTEDQEDPNKRRKVKARKRFRTSQRCNCPFAVSLAMTSDNVIRVTQCRLEHNHLKMTEAQFLKDPISRKRTEEQTRELEVLSCTDMSVKQINEVMNMKFPRNNFTYKDIYNDVFSLRKSRNSTALKSKKKLKSQEGDNVHTRKDMYEFLDSIPSSTLETPSTDTHTNKIDEDMNSTSTKNKNQRRKTKHDKNGHGRINPDKSSSPARYETLLYTAQDICNHAAETDEIYVEIKERLIEILASVKRLPVSAIRQQELNTEHQRLQQQHQEQQIQFQQAHHLVQSSFPNMLSTTTDLHGTSPSYDLRTKISTTDNLTRNTYMESFLSSHASSTLSNTLMGIEGPNSTSFEREEEQIFEDRNDITSSIVASSFSEEFQGYLV